MASAYGCGVGLLCAIEASKVVVCSNFIPLEVSLFQFLFADNTPHLTGPALLYLFVTYQIAAVKLGNQEWNLGASALLDNMVGW